MNSVIIALIGYYSAIYGVDPKVAVAVAQHESQFNVMAVGSKNERGLFQLKPTSFPEYKPDELFDPKTNIKLGVKYLAWSKKYCKHKDNLEWLSCYNAGVKKAEVFKHPSLFPYVLKIKEVMSKIKVGEKVMVKNLHHGKVDGEGTFLGVSQQKGFKGYYRIQATNIHLTVLIEPSRVTDYTTYWQAKKH